MIKKAGVEMDLIQKIKRIELYSYKNGSQYFSILPSTIHNPDEVIYASAELSEFVDEILQTID